MDGSYLVFAVKLKALRNTQNLAGLKIRADEILLLETKGVRNELIPFFKRYEGKGT